MAILLIGGLQPADTVADQNAGKGGNPGTKLTRGILNLGTGWLEVPAQMAERKKTDHTAVWWMVHGAIYGVMRGTARTLYGVFDILTFPVAPYSAPIMQPDTLIKPKRKPRDLEPLPPEKP